ncbi:class I SAM-dependent methyltransferase [Oscillospiraceae bacterium OttesenSCG-928-F05]|nr:class I SAM-dependent methyltransferase [Oscillospiraceae bacterium OttesenSCG-928-F05]
MNCKICGQNNVEVTYEGKIRRGAPGKMTEEDVPVYRCLSCDCIWHEPVIESAMLYQSDTYRESMDEVVTLDAFYEKHDDEILEKLKYTGTSVYRGKLVMDVGCGGGGYADYINGVASQIVLVEPAKNFAAQLRNKGYEVFPYMEKALEKYRNSIEVLTSYDVIEHVDDPEMFLRSVYDLLTPGGTAFIGTPTEYPVLRGLLGQTFDAFLFSVQHLWVLSRKNLELMAQKSGFSQCKVDYYQRFGLGNLIAWLQTNTPRGEAKYDFVSRSLDALYKSEMAKEETGEYLVLRLVK